jgi:hypothetical protein
MLPFLLLKWHYKSHGGALVNATQELLLPSRPTIANTLDVFYELLISQLAASLNA